MGSSRLTLAALLAVAALPAAAQQNYVVSSISQSYSALSNATVVSVPCSSTQTTDCMVNGGSWTLRDEGWVSISLGFSFPYYGNTYTSVGVNSNGVLVFGATDAAYCDYSSGGTIICTGGAPFPDSFRTPHNVIAPWWADSEGNSGGEIRYEKPNSSEIVIEFHDWSNYSANSGDSYEFQVRLNASGLFQVHYGSSSGSHFGSVGFENDSGSQGGSIISACQSCSSSDWPSNTLYTVGQPPPTTSTGRRTSPPTRSRMRAISSSTTRR
jgi:hypothetical protein